MVMPSGDIYIIGGTYSSTNSEVLPKGETAWIDGPNLPLSNFHFRACALALDHYRFVLIGDGQYHNMVGVYDIATGEWDNSWPNIQPVDQRTGHSCVKINDKIMVAGGYSYTTFDFLDSTLLIDSRTGKIEQGVAMKMARAYFSLVTVLGKVLAIGGKSHNNPKSHGVTYTDTWEEWDPDTKTWHHNSSLVVGRGAAAAVLLTCPGDTTKITATTTTTMVPTTVTTTATTTKQ